MLMCVCMMSECVCVCVCVHACMAKASSVSIYPSGNVFTNLCVGYNCNHLRTLIIVM